MRKEITWEEYQELLGKVPEGKRLVVTSGNRYFLEDKVIVPYFKLKKKKNEKK